MGLWYIGEWHGDYGLRAWKHSGDWRGLDGPYKYELECNASVWLIPGTLED